MPQHFAVSVIQAIKSGLDLLGNVIVAECDGDTGQLRDLSRARDIVEEAFFGWQPPEVEGPFRKQFRDLWRDEMFELGEIFVSLKRLLEDVNSREVLGEATFLCDEFSKSLDRLGAAKNSAEVAAEGAVLIAAVKTALSGALGTLTGQSELSVVRDSIEAIGDETNPDRLEEMRRLARTIASKWSFYDPRCLKEVTLRSDARDQSIMEVKEDTILAAMVLVFAQGREPQAVRFGSQWIKRSTQADLQDSPSDLKPLEDLSPEQMFLWFKRSVIKLAEEDLIGSSEQETFDLSRLREVKSPDITQPDELMIQMEDQSGAAEEISKLFHIATNSEREILFRVLELASRGEGVRWAGIGRDLGLSAGQVRQRISRLRVRAEEERKKGIRSA